jgi:hypothetical protein
MNTVLLVDLGGVPFTLTISIGSGCWVSASG